MLGETNAETGGFWTSRKPRFWLSMKYLFLKDLITKTRNISSIIEFLGACTLPFLLYPIYIFARSDVPANPSPVMLGPANFNATLGPFLYSVGKAEPRIVIMPNCSNTRVFKAFVIDPISEKMPLKSTIVNTIAELRDYIYQTDSNAFGINWINANESDAMRNPKFTIYEQVTYGQPEEGIVQLLVDYLTAMPFFPKLSHIDRVQFPTKKSHTEVDIQILYAFFAIIPAILATMPIIQNLLDEKGEKITTFMFLMGMTELQYWIVNFFMMVGLSLFAYLFFASEMCFWFSMNGTDITLFLTMTLLFLIAHTFFMFCFITIMQKSEHGRSQAVFFAIFGIFFAYVHQFYTLQPNASDKLKNGLSIIPLSTYQIMIMNFYDHCKRGYKGYQWSDFYEDSAYKISTGFMWFGIDIGVYFILYLILNTFLPREFGVQPMLLRDIFKRQSWHTLFHGRGTANHSQIINAKVALKVNNLHKKYNGLNPVEAVKDVSFEVKKGEVIVMIGPNGSGKSTIINTLSAAIKSSGGTISLFEGESTTQFQEIHKYLGICFQDNVLIGLLSVKEHFKLFGALRGIKKEDLNCAMDFFGSTLQLSHQMATRAKDLSGGQKRKLCLALSLLGNPPIVVMDEPTAGVDVQARQLIWKTISSLKESTCIITSHALEEAEAVSSRLFIVAGGDMPFQGTSTELRKQFNCGYILRVERNDGTAGPVLDLAHSIIPASKLSDERKDTIIVPVDRKASVLLEELDSKKEELGIKSYSFGVEQLEDTLIKMIQHAEAEIDMNH